MRVYHVTTTVGWAGIREDEIIDPRKSRGARLASWFIPEWKVGWAVCHVMTRHSVELVDVHIIRVDVHDDSLKLHGGSGLMYRTIATPFMGDQDVCSAIDWAHTGEFNFGTSDSVKFTDN